MEKISLEEPKRVEEGRNREQRASDTNEALRSELKKVKPITDAIRTVVDDKRAALDPERVKRFRLITFSDYMMAMDEQLRQDDPDSAKALGLIADRLGQSRLRSRNR